MIFYASIIAALGITLWLISYIAKMLSAKRPGLGWIILAWITGGILSTLLIIPIGIFANDIDPTILFIVTLGLSFIISSAAYKYINQMGWGGAFTTNIASYVIGLVTFVVAIIISGNSLKQTFNTITIAAQKNATMAGSLATHDISQDILLHQQKSNETGKNSENVDSQLVSDENANNNSDIDKEGTGEYLEPEFKEEDLLPKKLVRQNQAKEKPYVSPKYHVVRIDRINSLLGREIRIKKRNGNVVAGSLQKIRGNDVVVKQRIHGGEATIPVSLATIRKLEVYR